MTTPFKNLALKSTFVVVIPEKNKAFNVFAKVSDTVAIIVNVKGLDTNNIGKSQTFGDETAVYIVEHKSVPA